MITLSDKETNSNSSTSYIPCLYKKKCVLLVTVLLQFLIEVLFNTVKKIIKDDTKAERSN